VNTVEYTKPTLVLAGTAQALVLGVYVGSGDHNPPTVADTRPIPLGLGLDD
jgi:hypothetical protein